MHRNVLILRRQFFSRIPKNRIPDPSENRALEFKWEFRRFGICSVSAAIGINWSIFYVAAATALSARLQKKTVSLERSSVEQHRYAVSADICAGRGCSAASR
jgi:hypothetical protein